LGSVLHSLALGCAEFLRGFGHDYGPFLKWLLGAPDLLV